jgi:hypothetical protein
MEVRCKQLGYLQGLMHVINATWPHRDHLLVNLASPGEAAASAGTSTATIWRPAAWPLPGSCLRPLLPWLG